MHETSVHQFNPEMAPDSAFVRGALKHLVVGNQGRWTDPRRTPFHIVAIAPHTGQVVIEIDDFEDRGRRIEIPFEQVASYQIAIGSTEASAADTEQFGEIVARFNQPLQVPCPQAATARTLAALRDRQAGVRAWLSEHSLFLKQYIAADISLRRGSPELASDLRTFMRQSGLGDTEEEFATTFVSNPYGELIKGHRIVLAELGLVAYEGSVVRDSTLFDGQRTKERRAEHILNRLSFVRAFLGLLGLAEVTLYRGIVFDGRLEPPRNNSFISASFDVEVARSCYAPREVQRNGMLLRQVVPIERLFMTYLETAGFNRQFLEAEAVLLYQPGNLLF